MTAVPDHLARVVNLAGFEPLAWTAMDPAAFDYVAGGAGDEQTLAENDLAWRRWRVRPRVLVDVRRIDPATTLLGTPVAFPLAIAPMAAHGLAHADAEIATARAAAAAGVPFTLSTMATCSMEAVAAAVPEGIRWFQLYVQADPARSRDLVQRAEAAGYRAIVLTADLVRLGYRDRDRRSGFTLAGPHGNFADVPGGATHAGGAHGDGFAQLDEQAGTGLTWDDLDTIRGWSSLPLVLKGILTEEDARVAVEHGVTTIALSNHGARQLDRAPVALDVLEGIVAAVGAAAEVWVDGGVRRGVDLAIARALGARGVLLGRPVLWALAAGGQAGVERALAIVREEFEIALTLLGAPTPADLTRAHVVRATDA